MSVPSVDWPDEFVGDPDDLKMPESPLHRDAIDVIALAAQIALGSEFVCYRDMNWYPADGGNAMAPDLMVLGAGVLPTGAKSHRQCDALLPLPIVAVEVPSDTDSFGAFRAKMRRIQRLGVVPYVVEVEPGSCAVGRLGPDDSSLVSWEEQPIPELGGIRVAIEHDSIVARTPNGVTARTPAELAIGLRDSSQS